MKRESPFKNIPSQFELIPDGVRCEDYSHGLLVSCPSLLRGCLHSRPSSETNHQAYELLFYIERVANEKGKTGEARLKFRLKYSRFIVQSIMKALQRMKDEKDVKKYGKMVMRAVNYVLDDKEAIH